MPVYGCVCCGSNPACNLKRGSTAIEVRLSELGVCGVHVAGAWTAGLVPGLSSVMWPTSQALVYFRCPPAVAPLFASLPPFGADMSGSGFYGLVVAEPSSSPFPAVDADADLAAPCAEAYGQEDAAAAPAPVCAPPPPALSVKVKLGNHGAALPGKTDPRSALCATSSVHSRPYRRLSTPSHSFSPSLFLRCFAAPMVLCCYLRRVHMTL